ncbi:hypothetical protein J4212_04715 [Candidatus Woesearchaeota archaeon]|nr:hypothetical protein [Candidatus Woesearchaeota archaeon]
MKMSTTISIPKREYDYLKRCERIVKGIEEDESLSEEEISLIEAAKQSKSLSKGEFLSEFKEMQNA